MLCKLTFYIGLFVISIGSHFALFADQLSPAISCHSILKFVDCALLWDRNSVQLSFEDETKNLTIDIVFVNRHRQEIEYPHNKDQVIEIYIGRAALKGEKEIIIPGGSVEILLIKLLSKAAASEKDEMAKKNIEICIEGLRHRDRPWEAIADKFEIDKNIFEDKLNRAFSKQKTD